jgi:hypothetical protein
MAIWQIISYTVCFISLSDFRTEQAYKLTIYARDYESAYKILNNVKPAQVRDQPKYFFYKGFLAYKLGYKSEADKNLKTLLSLFEDIPDRYKVVGVLMLSDLTTWQDKDLGAVARKMEEVSDRLRLAKAGPVTQDKQKDIVRMLDKLIKEKEDKGKAKAKNEEDKDGTKRKIRMQSGPGRIQQAGGVPSNPLEESSIDNQGGPGTVDLSKARKLTARWGQLPPREQARALQELTQGMSPRHREAIYNYFRNISSTGKRP